MAQRRHQPLLSSLPSVSAIDHLKADGIGHSFSGQRVLSDISLTVAPGERVGLIGENGSGKSTLLKILAGALTADAGVVIRPADIGWYHQHIQLPSGSTITDVLDTAQERSATLLAELEDAAAALALPDGVRGTVVERYEAALEAAEREEVWAAQQRRQELLHAFALDALSGHTLVSELSGGQRSRLAFASVLLRNPFALILDEPTNHLDHDGISMLEELLRQWSGPVIFASHDRTFLDAVASKLLDLSPMSLPAGFAENDAATGYGVQVFSGNFSQYQIEHARLIELWRLRYRDEQRELRALRSEIETGAYQVNKKSESKSEIRMARKFYADKDSRVTARRIKNAEMRLKQLERDAVSAPPEPLEFVFPAQRHHTPKPSDVLEVTAIEVTGRSVSPISFTVPWGEQLLVSGANGTGKSTLLAMIAGQLQPSSGTILHPKHYRCGILRQDSNFAEPSLSVEEHYRSAVGWRIAERVPLEHFGLLHPRQFSQAVGTLSGGQQRRLELAVLLAKPPEILLLDEPTNHISLDLAEALEHALSSYQGIVIIASHDRRFAQGFKGKRIALASPSEPSQ